MLARENAREGGTKAQKLNVTTFIKPFEFGAARIAMPPRPFLSPGDANNGELNALYYCK